MKNLAKLWTEWMRLSKDSVGRYTMLTQSQLDARVMNSLLIKPCKARNNQTKQEIEVLFAVVHTVSHEVFVICQTDQFKWAIPLETFHKEYLVDGSQELIDWANQEFEKWFRRIAFPALSKLNKISDDEVKSLLEKAWRHADI